MPTSLVEAPANYHLLFLVHHYSLSLKLTSHSVAMLEPFLQVEQVPTGVFPYLPPLQMTNSAGKPNNEPRSHSSSHFKATYLL